MKEIEIHELLMRQRAERKDLRAPHPSRLLCPVCRQEHRDGEIKPGITRCIPCRPCQKELLALQDALEVIQLEGGIEDDGLSQSYKSRIPCPVGTDPGAKPDNDGMGESSEEPGVEDLFVELSSGDQRIGEWLL